MITQGPDLADVVIAFLNECAGKDPAAVIALVAARVPCNRALAEHPTVQVGADNVGTEREAFTVGLLGLLNGLCGALPAGPLAGHGYIVAYLDAPAGAIRFERADQAP